MRIIVMKDYWPRLIEKRIERLLKSSGAVAVEGPKFCGKTTTCGLFSKSKIELITEDIINIVQADPKLALVGEKPHLIDEWQTVPQIWDLVRKQVNDDGDFGEFLLTGSATPADTDKIHHSGAGRIAPLKMRPMSLYESGDSKGLISLADLFDKPNLSFFYQNDDFSLSNMAFLTCRGGWPMSVMKNREVSLDVTKNYYNGLFNFKNSENPKYKKKNPDYLKMLLKSYARNISTEAAYSTILKDLQNDGRRTMDIKTFDSYLNIAEELFIVEDMEAWCPNLRSSTTIRTTPTRHFVDTSIACRALSISPNDLLLNANTFGLFFEDLAVRDLRIYAETLDGTVRHYRDKNGLECDSVIHLEDGRWAPIEIKLGGEELIEGAAKKLKEFMDKLDPKYTKPSFMAIVVANGMAFRRPDGILVIPLNLLKN